MSEQRPQGPDRLDAVTFFDAQAQEYEQLSRQSPRFNERFAVWEELIDAHAPSREPSRCLDLGCGVGTLSRFAAARGFQTLGLDGSPAMIEKSRSLSGEQGDRLEFRETMIPLDDTLMDELEGTADLLLASSVVEYLDDAPGFMAQCERLLRRGGIAVVSFPNATSLYRRIEPLLKFRGSNYLRMKPRQYTRRDAGELAESAGLTVIEARYFAFPSLRLSRMIKRRSPLLATMFALVLRKN